MARKVHRRRVPRIRALSTSSYDQRPLIENVESQGLECFEDSTKSFDTGLDSASDASQTDPSQNDLQQMFLQQVLKFYHFSSSIYTTLNANGRIVQANLPFSDLVGVHLNLLTHYYLAHMIPSADRARFSAFLTQVIQHQDISTGRFRLRKKDGTIVTVDMEVVSFHDQLTAPHHYPFLIRVVNAQPERVNTQHPTPHGTEDVPLISNDPDAEYPKRLKQITRKLILSEHNQRKQYASQLHDFLGPRLTLCGYKVNQLQQYVKASSSHLAVEALTLLDEALTYTRMLITDLHCPVLADLGLCEGLRWLADRMRDFDLHVSLKVPRRAIDLPEGLDILIFEAVRELLMNVRKHGKVDRALVSVKVIHNQTLSVVVSDKGVGTNLSLLWRNSQKEQRFGLSTIRERLFAFQGELSLKSRPDEGMVATILVPNVVR